MTALNGVSQRVSYTDMSAGRSIRFVAGTIRNTGGTWAWIDDANHNPIPDGVGISQTSGTITLTYGFTASKVLSLIATPDDDMAKFYSCGVSVGLSSSVLVIYHQRPFGGKVSFNGSTWADTQSYQIDSFNYASGVLTVDHSAYLASSVADIQITSMNATYVPVLSAYSTTTFDVKFYDWAGAQYTGAANTNMAFTWTRSHILAADPGLTNYPASGNIWIFGIMEM